jgi:transposase
MGKRFRAWAPEQGLLLPLSVMDFVPPDHLAHFVRDLVIESLDLTAIMEEYDELRGYPPYHPVMMTAVLLYTYSQGIYSSRRIAKACEERVDFMAITGLARPDFRTISDFRKRHLEALSGLFVQVLRLCREVGMVKLGHVALDGTKVRANASKHKAMSYGRMKVAERQLEQEVQGWFDRAQRADEQEDAQYGGDRRGDELPEWVANKQRRLEKIREAKVALEAKAREDAGGSDADDPPRRGPGRPRIHPKGSPQDSAQCNFTDPDSGIMKTPDGFQQCYNAQAAVDASSQIIVSQDVTGCATDRNHMVPMLDRIEAQAGSRPQEVSADSDYCTEAALEELERRQIRGYVATGKQVHGTPASTANRPTTPGTLRHQMKLRLQRGSHRSRYRLRKQTVEPVFGQIKHGRGFRQFFLRGIAKVRGEWALLCTAHNLVKLAAATAV